MTNAQASGKNRVGQQIEIYAGDIAGAVNKIRYNIYENGVLAATYTQVTGDLDFGNLVYLIPSTAAYDPFSCTVEWSVNNGTTYSAAVEPYYSFYPDTMQTEPASIAPDLALTRTSAAGASPLTFNITGTILASYEWELVRYSSDGITEVHRARKPVTEYEIANNVLDEVNEPAFYPPLPARNTTDIDVLRLITQDWVENFYPADCIGAASPWVGVSATDFGGSRQYRVEISATPAGSATAVVMSAFGLRESAGGANVLLDSTGRRKAFNVTFSAGDESTHVPAGSTYDSVHIFDGESATYGALTDTPAYMIIDLLVPRPVVEAFITSEVSTYTVAPGSFKIFDNAAGTGTPLVDQTGVTWSSSADETKAYNWAAPAWTPADAASANLLSMFVPSLSNTFQNDAGTTAVTATGQDVHAIKDNAGRKVGGTNISGVYPKYAVSGGKAYLDCTGGGQLWPGDSFKPQHATTGKFTHAVAIRPRSTADQRVFTVQAEWEAVGGAWRAKSITTVGSAIGATAGSVIAEAVARLILVGRTDGGGNAEYQLYANNVAGTASDPGSPHNLSTDNQGMSVGPFGTTAGFDLLGWAIFDNELSSTERGKLDTWLQNLA